MNSNSWSGSNQRLGKSAKHHIIAALPVFLVAGTLWLFLGTMLFPCLISWVNSACCFLHCISPRYFMALPWDVGMVVVFKEAETFKKWCSSQSFK